MEPREAIEIIKRMYKGTPTTDQMMALEVAYEALERQYQESSLKENIFALNVKT